MNTYSDNHRRRALRLGTTGVAVLASVALLAACSSAASTTAATPTTGSSSPSTSGGSSPVSRRGPEAFGLAAAISGRTVQVQDPATGQVAVTYTPTTTFTASRKVPLSAIKPGDCITAISAVSTSTEATPAPAATRTALTAATIAITSTTSATCTLGGAGGGPGSAPGGTGQSGRPAGAPRSGSTFSPGSTPRAFAAATSGKVVTVSGSTIRLTSTRSGQATTVTVTTSPATTATEVVRSTAKALKVGECVSANGTANSIGAVTATRIALSTPGPNGCTSGFGRRFGSSTGGGNNA